MMPTTTRLTVRSTVSLMTRTRMDITPVIQSLATSSAVVVCRLIGWIFEIHFMLLLYSGYGDGVGDTAEVNYSVLSLIGVCRPSGCKVVSGVVVGVCNCSQTRTSRR